MRRPFLMQRPFSVQRCVRPKRGRRQLTLLACGLLVAMGQPVLAAADRAGLIEKYCLECHNTTDWAGGIALDALPMDDVASEGKTWETVVRKLRGGLMPPPGKPRPDAHALEGLIVGLETELDAAAAARPTPGHVGPHRLNRSEYANAVRDILGIDVDPESLLPKEVESEGFENIAEVLKVSPSFLDQYITAADVLTTRALGDPQAAPESVVYRVPETANQSKYVPGLPFGTRGGILMRHDFPTDGDYEININGLAGSTYIWGLDYPDRVIVTLDGEQVFEGRLGGTADLEAADQRMENAVKEINARFQKLRLRVPAGPHDLGVTFVERSLAESDEILHDFAPDTGVPRVAKVANVEITGPFNAGPVSETPSRRRILVCRPQNAAEERPCAEQILLQAARKAYRRSVSRDELEGVLAFYEKGRALGSFDKGIQYGLMGILASPKFLYRTERAPESTDVPERFALSDLDLASRLSFFLWSRPPDEALLRAAEAGDLRTAAGLQAQLKRMLADGRSRSLVTSFAFQWLGVKGLDRVDPDPSIFPEFDADLRRAFERELEYFIASIFDADRGVLDLLTADHTFVNGRLAQHYGIGSVRGDRFQRVTLKDTYRWGLLGKGGLLMATSYADRTSPVVRGAYVLERIIGVPPTPPPPNVEAFPENKAGEKPKTVRARLEQHRATPSCNSCHGVMDPLGLALENFNAIGEYRTLDRDAHALIDTSGQLVDGTPIKGPDDLRKALAQRPEQFAHTFTEKLMTFALGRTLEWYDMPTVRQIVREAAPGGYRFSTIVAGVVASDAFRTAGRPAATSSDTRTALSDGAQQEVRRVHHP